MHNLMHTMSHDQPLVPRSAIATALVGALVVGICLWPRGLRRDAASRERAFGRENKHLVAIPSGVPEGRAGRTITLGPNELATHELYLRGANGGPSWLLLRSDGVMESAAGPVGAVQEAVELLLTPSGTTLFVDHVPVMAGAGTWKAFWVVGEAHAEPPADTVIPTVSVRDGFEREELDVHPYARIAAGTVRLAQHGGGMPTTAAEEADFNFQRAVNPFSIHAADGGRLTYRVHAPRHWADTHAEARFYFGIPKTGNVVDRQTVPTDTDMLVVMGPEDGFQAAFGWSGAEACFVLQTRVGNGPWGVSARWDSRRPPLTNWMTIGLECRRGYRIRGMLDGVEVLSAELSERLRGPFHIQVGNGLAEFDDVRAWSLPPPPPEPSPLRIQSRQFAGKRRKDKADQEEFDQWAASSDAFETVTWRDEKTGDACAGLVTRQGLLGDMYCESLPESIPGALPGATYHIGLYACLREGEPTDIRTDAPVAAVRAEPRDAAWRVMPGEGSYAGPDSSVALPVLEVARLHSQGNRLCIRMGGRWVPVSDPIDGCVRLAIVRVLGQDSGKRGVLPPDPDQHTVRCANLVHELFEAAPTAWNWVDGAFRMDCRWACQDQWNFMACGSTGLPYMASKRVFNGDQVHEAFLCLRATFPWDAGDTSFQYDSNADRANKFARLRAANAWYNRHDLNLSFCSDGRNPLSGYALVFGGEDNRVTRLLRRGVTVAQSLRPEHLFPTDASFMAVHWLWWRVTIRKTGPRVRIFLDDNLLFDYLDPEPLSGGHIGFWSVRNGFAISRVSSMAEMISSDPHELYVPNRKTGPDAGWHPLVRDTVSLETEAETGHLRVTNTYGGGFFAVRYVPEHPIDLRETPRLDLPVDLGEGVRVNLHLEIGGKPFVVRLGDSPLDGMKAFIVPGSETGECFQLNVMPEAAVRARHCLAEVTPGSGQVSLDLLEALRKLSVGDVEPVLTCLTVGNSSNTDYLMAGGGWNVAGTSYRVGEPVFSERETH